MSVLTFELTLNLVRRRWWWSTDSTNAHTYANQGNKEKQFYANFSKGWPVVNWATEQRRRKLDNNEVGKRGRRRATMKCFNETDVKDAF